MKKATAFYGRANFPDSVLVGARKRKKEEKRAKKKEEKKCFFFFFFFVTPDSEKSTELPDSVLVGAQKREIYASVKRRSDFHTLVVEWGFANHAKPRKPVRCVSRFRM